MQLAASKPYPAGDDTHLVPVLPDRLASQTPPYLPDPIGLMERRARRAARLETLGQLSVGVAHDFNNLLSIIAGYGELLRRRVERDDLALRHVQQLLRACERGSALVSQLRAFGRREPGPATRVSLAGIAKEIEALLGRLLGEDVDLRLLLGGPAWVAADATQLEQVLMNLVINAREAMPDGGALTIRIASIEPASGDAEPGNEWVLLEVADSGVGMDAATRERLFEPFFTTKPQGTGLGLATVHAIVRQLGGHIHVESEPQRGSCFQVHLPGAGRHAYESSQPATGKTIQNGGRS